MVEVNFEIIRIYAGWFDIKFITKEKQVEISASDAWGNDSPKYFLRMILDVLDNKISAGYVIFDEEPGTYIVGLEKDTACKLFILYSDFDDDEWRQTELHGELKRKEIETLIPNTEELFSVENFSICSFARTVLRSFEECSSKAKMSEYEENWMEFPQKELEQLSRMLYRNEEELVGMYG